MVSETNIRLLQQINVTFWWKLASKTNYLFYRFMHFSHKFDLFPWKVGVEIDGRFPWCGGSLISGTEILTAAHCTHGKSPSSVKVFLIVLIIFKRYQGDSGWERHRRHGADEAGGCGGGDPPDVQRLQLQQRLLHPSPPLPALILLQHQSCLSSLGCHRHLYRRGNLVSLHQLFAPHGALYLTQSRGPTQSHPIHPYIHLKHHSATSMMVFFVLPCDPSHCLLRWPQWLGGGPWGEKSKCHQSCRQESD